MSLISFSDFATVLSSPYPLQVQYKDSRVTRLCKYGDCPIQWKETLYFEEDQVPRENCGVIQEADHESSPGTDASLPNIPYALMQLEKCLDALNLISFQRDGTCAIL